jgi:hypothetical protein
MIRMGATVGALALIILFGAYFIFQALRKAKTDLYGSDARAARRGAMSMASSGKYNDLLAAIRDTATDRTGAGVTSPHAAFAAAQALGQIAKDDDKALEALLEAAKVKSPAVQAAAAYGLGLCGRPKDDKVIDQLTEIGKTDGIGQDRALSALADLGAIAGIVNTGKTGPTVTAALKQAVRSSDRCAAALPAVIQARNDTAKECIALMLADPDGLDSSALLHVADSDQKEVRLEVVALLEGGAGPRMAAVLEKLVGDPDPEVRGKALEAAAKMSGETKAVERRLFDKQYLETDPKLRAAAAKALSASIKPEQTPSLLRLVGLMSGTGELPETRERAADGVKTCVAALVKAAGEAKDADQKDKILPDMLKGFLVERLGPCAADRARAGSEEVREAARTIIRSACDERVDDEKSYKRALKRWGQLGLAEYSIGFAKAKYPADKKKEVSYIVYESMTRAYKLWVEESDDVKARALEVLKRGGEVVWAEKQYRTSQLNPFWRAIGKPEVAAPAPPKRPVPKAKPKQPQPDKPDNTDTDDQQDEPAPKKIR